MVEEEEAWSRSLRQEVVVGGSPVDLLENRRQAAAVEGGDCPWRVEAEESWWAGVAVWSSWQPEEEEEEGAGPGVEEEGPRPLEVEEEEEEEGHRQSPAGK